MKVGTQKKNPAQYLLQIFSESCLILGYFQLQYHKCPSGRVVSRTSLHLISVSRFGQIPFFIPALFPQIELFILPGDRGRAVF